jgi:hypothetical protein
MLVLGFKKLEQSLPKIKIDVNANGVAHMETPS